jgi:hypothetical protein
VGIANANAVVLELEDPDAGGKDRDCRDGGQ